ncbi:MAG: hypothetical protein AAFQ94_27185 [Bacteroidota bacterium]
MDYPFIRLKYYTSLFKDIVNFIKEPHSRPDLEKSIKWKVYDTVGLFILKMILLIPLLLFFAFIYDPEDIQSVSMSERFSPVVFLLIGGFILPLVEEVAFRLSLKFSPIYLSLSSSTLFYYFLTKAIFNTKISMVDESFTLRVSVAVAFGGILFLILNIKTVKNHVTNFWNSQFQIIYYCSCLVFAWMHISKYEIIWVNILLLPIITLPQLFSAIIYGYSRVSFGFRYPLILHVTMNTIALGLSVLQV